ncbi:hypothetical protein C8J55DRAFT_558004 [Lentinula edodes]|uniref:C2H2-type domain-containing protein n=1 Tax=Lentinula lateritia TaxID=40482 RepID=A0A9W9ATM9_9AGAR|nr:hypothetical protein C8J55DRAFT_558004 [Lentinula edodes]
MVKQSCQFCDKKYEKGHGLSKHEKVCASGKRLQPNLSGSRAKAAEAFKKLDRDRKIKKREKKALKNSTTDTDIFMNEPVDTNLDQYDIEMAEYSNFNSERPLAVPAPSDNVAPADPVLRDSSIHPASNRTEGLPDDLIPSHPGTLPSSLPTRTHLTPLPSPPVSHPRQKSPSPDLPSTTVSTEPNDVCGSKESSQDAPESPYAPFANPSIYHMMKYAYGKHAEGLAAAQKINDDVIQQPCFDPRDLIGFNAQKEAKKLDAYQSQTISTPSQSKFPFENHSGWTRSSVNISLPCAGARNPEDKAPKFKVDGVIHQDLLSVRQEAYTGDGAAEFHLRGFKQMWNREGHAQPIRIYGEVYTSDAYLTMEKEVLVSPLEPGCDLERVIVPIMAYSDSTHLPSFGSASLWPGYLWFGSQSKYSRAKPSKFSAHHLVYFPSLPKKVEDAYKKQFGTAPTDSVKTHLKRELHSEIWKLLLTPEFIDAYTNGIVVEGPDGILRRLYSRIFTYSADYPEKVLLASIKNLGTHLCPRCTTRKDQAWEIGTREDMTHRERLHRIDTKTQSEAVKNLLKSSQVPTRSAFSEAFQELGSDMFRLFVVDVMHEVELGVFKSLFTHLVRMAHVMGKDTVQELNERFCKVPTFGRSTIRRFVENASEMTKLGARDFEDLLQCAPACFEGLFTSKSQEIDDLVQDLLGQMASWHAYAKLRLHTDLTLDSFEVATTELGDLFRCFATKTVEEFDTRPLPCEVAAASRRKANAQAKGKDQPNVQTPKPKQKLFNMNTYKFHALSDYPWTIWTFGTTDSYSTQLGELEHRRVKRFYARTNRNQFSFQIACHEHRRRTLQMISKQKGHQYQGRVTRSQVATPSLSFSDSDPLPFTNPMTCYHMSSSTRYFQNLTIWLGELRDDPAFTVNYLFIL